MSCRCHRPGWLGGDHDQGCPYEDGKTPWFEVDIAVLKVDLARQTKIAETWRTVLDAVEPNALRRAICQTCPSNECQIRELCTSATACRSLYALAAEASKQP